MKVSDLIMSREEEYAHMEALVPCIPSGPSHTSHVKE